MGVHSSGSPIATAGAWVGEKNEVSIRDIAFKIADCFNYTDKLEFDDSKPDGQFKKTADNTKLMNLIGNFNFTDINYGINKSVEWFIDNYNKKALYIYIKEMIDVKSNKITQVSKKLAKIYKDQFIFYKENDYFNC